MNYKILINSWKSIDKLYGKIGRGLDKLYGKIGRSLNLLPLAAPGRSKIYPAHPQVRGGIDHPYPEIGKSINHPYPAIQGNALALAVLTDWFILHKGKAYEDEYGRYDLTHGKSFYEK